MVGTRCIQNNKTLDKQGVNKDMTIGQAYEWIARAGENVQVFCHPRQNVRGTYKEVSVFSNRDRVQSARRERDHGERLIGVFNTDINYNSFKAECSRFDSGVSLTHWRDRGNSRVTRRLTCCPGTGAVARATATRC